MAFNLQRSRVVALLALVLSSGLAGCASAGRARVLAKENGQLQAYGTDAQESRATLAAVDAAKDFCKERGAQTVFLDEGPPRCPQSEMDKAVDKAVSVLERLPVISKAVRAGEDSQVTLAFRCS